MTTSHCTPRSLPMSTQRGSRAAVNFTIKITPGAHLRIFTNLPIILDQKAQQRAGCPLNPQSILMFGGVASPNLGFEQLPLSATPPNALPSHLLLACAQPHPFLAGPKESLVCRAVQPASRSQHCTLCSGKSHL
jgi:hypothetical protein